MKKIKSIYVREIGKKQPTQKQYEEMDEREEAEEIYNFDGEFTLPQD